MCLRCIGSSRHLKKKNTCWQGFYNTIDRLLVSVLILYHLFSCVSECAWRFLHLLKTNQWSTVTSRIWKNN
jgi:hypothetical protein